MKLRVLLASVLAVAGLGLAGAGPADAAPPWAPAESATIHPGVMTFTEGGQCTANFVFVEGARVFIGQAAHCSATGGQTETNGCEAGSRPLDTLVEIDGATRPGRMVYNSWLTMQSIGETDPNACDYNDFALIEIDPVDHARVNPSIPVYGGPIGISPGVGFGDEVYSYGNSSLRLGLSPLSPKAGVSLGTTGGGWTHPVYTVSPGIPGDSGSAFVDGQGRALGVLSTLVIAPTPASNNVSDIGSAIDYMHAHSPLQAELVNGTEPFRGAGGILTRTTSALRVGR